MSNDILVFKADIRVPCNKWSNDEEKNDMMESVRDILQYALNTELYCSEAVVTDVVVEDTELAVDDMIKLLVEHGIVSSDLLDD